MAQKIQTLCDVHLDKGDEIPGQTWAFSVSEPGKRPRGFELDACPECTEQLAAIFESVAEHARQTSGSRRDGTRVTPTPGAGEEQCPLCDARPVSRDALDSHLRDLHNTSIAQREGTAKLACPVKGCDRKLVNPTGRTAHVRGKHPEHYAKHGTEPAPA